MIFTRFANSQVGSGQPMIRPLESERFDYEGEMAVIIGKAGRRIAREAALAHVAGYACYNDGSIRDWQRHTSQFAPGKNFVGTGAFGPWMVTTDEIPDISKQTIATRLNGVEVQAAPISDLVFDVPALIAYCSTFTELVPGDVIVTGTTGGVGAYRTPPLWMKEGDVVEVEVSGIGVLAQSGQGRGCGRGDARGLRIGTSNNKSKETIMNLPKHLLPTTVVGSYPQPEWLVDRAMLSKVVPRTRMHAMWRLPAEHLEEAQDDATIVAIRDMERAGIDVVTDGEIRRESYSNRFATALEGIDDENPAIITARNGTQTPVPRVVGEVKRSKPVELHDMEFLRKNTERAAKITLPGPFTMSQQAKNEFYEDDEELAMAFAAAVNAEALDLQKAGADVIQLDEPWVRNNPDLARRYAVKAINRALQGITVPTVVHLCFGYAAVVPGSTKPAGYSFLAELADTNAEQISIEAAQPKLDLGVLRDLSSKKIMLGVLDLGNPEIETAEVVAGRIRNGLKHVAADRLVVAPDCGMKYMPRHTAFGKLKAMCDAAATVRKEIS